MDFESKTVGFALCGSFCTFKKAMDALYELSLTNANIIPIMSDISYSTDTRFGTADYFRREVESITGNSIIHTVKEAEPIGPKKLLDVLAVLPCTGNTLAKIANGITDTAVTMAVKAHLRNQRPVVIAVSTNDGLGNAAKNIGALMNMKNIFFLPMAQDSCFKKPNSLVADFSALIPTIEAACENRQYQPVLSK